MVLSACVIGIAGCGATKPMKVTGPRLDTCPLPDGFKMKPAIQVAEMTLSNCPEKLDDVFAKLVKIAKDSPSPENGVLIQDLLKRLIKENKISETYTKSLYQQYFSRTFVSLPDVKVYRLSGELTDIKKALRNELARKKIGMVECCGDRASYEDALNEYARTLSFMENLILNEAYLKES
jgi:hypothetical protein